MEKDLKITLVIPTYNEIVGMKKIMKRVDSSLFHQIIVVDGGSTDGTLEYALKSGYQVYKQVRKGIRLGYIENYENITGDYIITFSPDGNSIPEFLPHLIEELKKGYDMVIVSRYIGYARSHDDTLLSKLGNWFFTKLINLLFGFRFTDSIVMFRGYKKNIPEKLGLTKVRSGFYEKYIGRYISWEPTLSMRCAKCRMKITEIPGDEPKRVEDEEDSTLRGFLLPSTRINHFRSGFACLYAVFEEFFKKKEKININ